MNPIPIGLAINENQPFGWHPYRSRQDSNL